MTAGKLAGILALLSGSVVLQAAAQSDPSAVTTAERQKRGAYTFALGGCASCHTDSKNDGQPLAGGLKMETPFGTFYTPNISPDPQQGIGGWSDADFLRAMRKGISPEGEHYYPAFPYTSYTRMSDRELLDLKAYLDSQPPVKVASREHQLSFPFSRRELLGVWKWLNFDEQRFQPNPDKSPSWNRGAYIVRGPGHCVECHTPRNMLGGMDSDAGMIGNENGPEGEAVPALVAGFNKGFDSWDIADIVFSLEAGMKPDGDFFGGSMGHVVENSTSRLTEEDLKAIAEYLKSPAD